MGEPDGATQFRYEASITMYHPGSRECQKRLIRYSPATEREIITDASCETVNREALEKPCFLFGDKVMVFDEVLFEKESKWFHQVVGLFIFFPDMERSYPLVYLQKLSTPCRMDLDIT